MADVYRVSSLGFALPKGAHVLEPGTVIDIEASNALMQTTEERVRALMAEAQQAFEEERRRGYEVGKREAEREWADRLVRESRALHEALEKLEVDLTELVVTCVKKIFESFDDATLAKSMVTSAMKQFRRERRVEIRVAPSVAAEIRSYCESLRRDYPDVHVFDVLDDEQLEGSHVVVDTAIGRIDAELGRSLDVLQALLRRATLEGLAVSDAGNEAVSDGDDND